MKSIIYLLAFVLFTMVLTSCEEENSEPKDKKLVPVKITYYGEDYSGEEIYTYNNTNKLIKIAKGGDSTIIEYDPEGKLVKMTEYEESQLWSYDIYEYNSLNQIIKIQAYDYEGDARNLSMYNYDSNGNIIDVTEYGTYSSIDSYFAFSYDNNGNMISKNYYLANSSGIISSTPYEEWTYTYDDKNHILKFVSLPFFDETNINNVIQRNLTEHDEGDTYYQRYNLTYGYNEDNYPIECIENIDDERYEIEYKEIK